MATGRIPTTANSPLTAKGDLFTFSTGSAKLAVGNNGETLVADSSTSTGLRYKEDYAAGKNKVINGDFGVWQRGTSFSNPGSGTVTADRWFIAYDGTPTTQTVSQQTFTPGTAPVAGYEGQYFFRWAVTTAGTMSQRYFWEKLEDVRTFAGQTVTYSFWAKASTTVTLESTIGNQVFGSGGSSFVGGTAQSNSLTTSWQRFTQTATVASIAGKTIGTGSYLEAAFNTTNVTATIDIWGVQLEAGSTATAFQTATGTIQGELAACQRYYWRTTGQAATNNDLMTGWANSTTSAVGILRFPVTMRTAATGNFSAAGDFSFVWSAGVSTITGAAIDRISSESMNLRLTTTGLTTGQGGAMYLQTGTTKWLEASAEL